MLELINLNKVYVNSNNVKVHALKDVSLKFDNKGLTFIIGPSGGGKSTLLNIISGLDGFDSGQMLIKGVDSHQLNESAFDSYRNTYVGFVFQEYNLLDHLTLAENVSLAVELKNQRPSKEEISRIFEELGIGGLENRYPNEISGGQRQRVAIARVLVKKPAILFADEPAGSVDKESRKYIYDTLKKLSKEILVVAVTHNADVPYIYGDRIITVDDGRIVKDERMSGEVTFADTYGKDEVMVVEAGKELNHFDLEKIRSMVDSKKDKEVYVCVEDKMKAVETLHPKLADTIKKDKAKKEAAAKKALAAKDTTAEVNSADSEPFQLVKAKLPAKSAWKLAKTQFGSNKIKTIFTIILTALAISFFAVSTILTGFSGSKANIEAFKNGNSAYLTMQNNTLLTSADLDKISSKASDSSAAQVALISNFGKGEFDTTDGSKVFVDRFIRLTGTESKTTMFGEKLIITSDVKSEFPTMDDAKGIVISDYTASELVRLKHAQAEKIGDLIGKTLGSDQYVIKGIYETNYNAIKESAKTNKDMKTQLDQLVESNYRTIYVSEAFLENQLATVASRDFENNTTLTIANSDKVYTNHGEALTIKNGGEGNSVAKVVVPESWKDYIENNQITLHVKRSKITDKEEGRSVTEEIATVTLNAEATGTVANEVVVYGDDFDTLANALVAPSTSVALGRNFSIKELTNIVSAYNKATVISVNSAEIDEFVYRFGVVGNAFLVTSIILGMFAILLLYNFVSESVRSKRKNIGILRAIGAGMKDVFAIFMIEAALLALFILIGSYTITIVATIIANAVVQAGALYGLALFNFKALTFLWIFIVAIIVSFVGYAIPLISLSRIKPIEIITRKTGI